MDMRLGCVISTRDLETFSLACERLYAPGLRADNYAGYAVAFLRELVSAEVYCVGDLDRASGDLTVDFSEPGPQFREALGGFSRTMHQYPLFNWDPTVNNGKPFLRRDFFTERQFRDLDIYSESFSLVGWLNHAAVHVPTQDEHVVFIGLERGKGPDYSERDRLILTLAQKHLSNARALSLSISSARGLTPPAPAIFVKRGFSRREAEVLSWLTEGKGNGEIAMLLNISLPTVRFHLRAIYDRLGTNNRLAVNLFALDLTRSASADRGAVGAKTYTVKTPAPFSPPPVRPPPRSTAFTQKSNSQK